MLFKLHSYQGCIQEGSRFSNLKWVAELLYCLTLIIVGGNLLVQDTTIDGEALYCTHLHTGLFTSHVQYFHICEV